MMKKNKASNYFLVMSIFSCLAFFVYLVANSYSKLMLPIKSLDNNDLLAPVTVDLDTKVTELIEARRSDNQ